jgi:4-hydroxymandelate oxidase
VQRRELLKFLVGGVGGLAGTASFPVVVRAQGAPSGTPAPPVNLFEFESLARQRLSRTAYEYLREKRWSGLPPYTHPSAVGGRPSPIYSGPQDSTVTWETIAWIRSFARTPVLLKGVLAPEDARRAADEGLAGVIVSNHGGRNLDTTPATIEALPAVAAAVDGRVPILLDSGVRRGTDVVKAVALGARAVLIGRPYLWGLAADGAAGVQRVIEILKGELETAMALCGAPTLERIKRQLVWSER